MATSSSKNHKTLIHNWFEEVCNKVIKTPKTLIYLIDKSEKPFLSAMNVCLYYNC